MCLLQCDWEGALKVIDHAINDMPRTDHRLLVFRLSSVSLTFMTLAFASLVAMSFLFQLYCKVVFCQLFTNKRI